MEIEAKGYEYPDDYFNENGKYLGTDNSETDNIRIMNEGQWNLNKEEDGTIDPMIGTGMSTLHSQSNINTGASLSIFQHYNSTGLKLINGDSGSEGGGMEINTINGKLSHIIVDIAGFKRSRVTDHSFEIRNIFVHENKHVTDFKAWGLTTYNSIPRAIIEQRAIMTQIKDPTFNLMRPVMQREVRRYGERYGMLFNIQSPTPLLKTPSVSAKRSIK